MKRIWLLVIVALVGLGAYLYMRPVSSVGPISRISAVPRTQEIALPWPGSGQAALGASGYGLLASHNAGQPVSIASIAKVITALAVLRQKPLVPGSQGPTLTLDSTDVDFFNYYYTRDGSVANVKDGEQISEYQALETMLIPSANNMADSLARWAFGSVSSYVTYANQMVKNMGLSHTKVGDSNGFSDTTTSTADDLVKLGLAALSNPTVAQIVSQKTAQVPVQGTINNVNWLLGQDGVVGIKTGNTDNAGGCYLFAAKQEVQGHSITLVGAVLGTAQLNDAISAASPLIKASDNGFEQVKIVHQNQVMGSYKSPWNSTAQFRASKDLSLFVWKGQDIKILNQPNTINAPQSAGAQVGSVTVQSGQQTATAPLLLNNNLAKPSWWWRLSHH